MFNKIDLFENTPITKSSKFPIVDSLYNWIVKKLKDKKHKIKTNILKLLNVPQILNPQKIKEMFEAIPNIVNRYLYWNRSFCLIKVS